MKNAKLKILTALCALSVLCVSLVSASAVEPDTNPVITPTGPEPEPTNSVSDYLPDHFSSVTNIALIPYVKYDLSSHTVGYGAAALYKVTDNFWTGLRADRLDGRETTAGVQAQLQTTFTWAGFQVTPFLATSVGLGQDSLYGSAGPGAFLHVFSHTWRPSGHDITLNVEVVGDYEHVVSDGRNSDQINAGPILNLKF